MSESSAGVVRGEGCAHHRADLERQHPPRGGGAGGPLSSGGPGDLRRVQGSRGRGLAHRRGDRPRSGAHGAHPEDGQRSLLRSPAPGGDHRAGPGGPGVPRAPGPGGVVRAGGDEQEGQPDRDAAVAAHAVHRRAGGRPVAPRPRRRLRDRAGPRDHARHRRARHARGRAQAARRGARPDAARRPPHRDGRAPDLRHRSRGARSRVHPPVGPPPVLRGGGADPPRARGRAHREPGRGRAPRGRRHLAARPRAGGGGGRHAARHAMAAF